MLFTTAAITLLSVVGTAMAATVRVNTRCTDNVFLQLTDSSGVTKQVTLATNGTYSQPLVGSGKQIGITKNADYFASTTPKLVFAYSVAPPTTYWTVSNISGNPFSDSSFAINPTKLECPSITSPDSAVHTCDDAVSYFPT